MHNYWRSCRGSPAPLKKPRSTTFYGTEFQYHGCRWRVFMEANAILEVPRGNEFMTSAASFVVNNKPPCSDTFTPLYSHHFFHLLSIEFCVKAFAAF
jgi:hypothetical protein